MSKSLRSHNVVVDSKALKPCIGDLRPPVLTKPTVPVSAIEPVVGGFVSARVSEIIEEQLHSTRRLQLVKKEPVTNNKIHEIATWP